MNDGANTKNSKKTLEPNSEAVNLPPDELAFLELLKKDLKLQQDIDNMHYETILAKVPTEPFIRSKT